MNRINRRLVLLSLPLIAGFLLFYLLPLIGSVRYSFVKSAFDQSFVGWENYRETLNNRNFQLSVRNTLELLLTGVPMLVITALSLALLVKSIGERMPVLRAALLLPMLLPSAAVADVFGKLGVSNPRIPLLAIYVWKNAGFLMLIFLAAFSMVPKEIYEAASLDGANRRQLLFRMTIPMISGAIAFSVILAAAYNLRLFREAYVLYGAYPDQSVYLTQHYMNNHFYKLNYQKLTTAASMFSCVLFVFVGLGLWISRKLTEGRG